MAASLSKQVTIGVSLSKQVTIGILSASFWRGSWYVLDHTLFPDNRTKSGISSLALGSTLLGLKQYILSPQYNGTKLLVQLLPPPQSISLRTRYLQINRFIVLYGIATACVLIWRGTWLLSDEIAHRIANAYYDAKYSSKELETIQKSNTTQQLQRKQEDDSRGIVRKITQQQHYGNVSIYNIKQQQQQHTTIDHHGESSVTQHDDLDEQTLFYSGIASHVVATISLLFMGRFASVMAPPANVSLLRDTFIHGRGKMFRSAAKSFTRSQ